MDASADHQETPNKPRPELEEVEHHGQPWMLTTTEAKLLGIAGVGFFLDAYDLFIINPVTTMLQYRLYGGKHLPADLEGLVKAGANIGSVIGQFLFGYLADSLGRHKVSHPDHSLIYLAIWRIVLGVGVGGDYPMSASVTSDRANIRKRGTMLTYIFANQGWGSLVGSLVIITLLAIYKHTIDIEGHISKVDGIWRIAVGLSLIPAFGTLYQRLTLGESTRYEKSKKLTEYSPGSPSDSEEGLSKLKDLSGKGGDATQVKNVDDNADVRSLAPEEVVKKPAHFKEFLRYFRRWENAKLLFATSASWFLLDIAFYGINLNQNVVLQQIGFDGATGSAWHKLFRVSTGGIIITVLGFVPGYYATLFTIEILGRKWIQIQGFLVSALFLAFIVCFAFLQFFFNFGANTTTYCYLLNVRLTSSLSVPTRYKAFAHGISAASGKAGAIISALAFNRLSKSIGTPAVLWIFFGCCMVGAVVSLLLPEVKGRDADVIFAEQIRERRRKQGAEVDID
ncbi:phosphate transporter [Coprinellus micaceus]|uniref:Phosphate transporter n=1 Tax=Coprinellus micaceus TaxID=71717 RepID=A0A4Y7RP94_COPMI|nr:phosphate transporter [Coprinellus micaceus]